MCTTLFLCIVHLMQVFSVLTLNINAVTTVHKIASFTDFLRHGGYTIVFLQEVSASVFDDVPGYEVIYNFDTDTNRGTAILYKTGLAPTDIQLLPTGKAISCVINGVHFVNVYAPSGTNQRRARASLFNTTICPFMATNRPLVFGGDFNCVVSSNDQYPTPNTCAELTELLAAKDLTDTWRHFYPRQHQYTHFYNGGASRIDRI